MPTAVPAKSQEVPAATSAPLSTVAKVDGDFAIWLRLESKPGKASISMFHAAKFGRESYPHAYSFLNLPDSPHLHLGAGYMHACYDLQALLSSASC